ncbi:MAG TPA: hypothetical protein VFQ69_11345 [Rhizomicrobium sp.]|jgi:hypothetical protein|nr:hypothetical protein [Rhizomicrobium sp.]
MYQDSWGLYEVRRPRKWIFHPRRRSYAMPAAATGLALLLAFLAMH